MELNQLRDRAYKCALNHGFHEKELSNEHWLWLVITELAEATEADRKGKHADRNQFDNYMNMKERSDDEFSYAFKHNIKDGVEDELSDACIRLLDFAGLRDIDLDDYEYSESDTEGYSDLTFTESMLYITEEIANGFYANMDIELAVPSIINEILCFCKSRDIDILWHIEQKMKYNETRPYKHGKQY